METEVLFRIGSLPAAASPSDPTGTGRGVLQEFADGLALLLADFIERFGGGPDSFLQRTLFAGITGAELITAAVFVALVLFINDVVLRAVRRRLLATQTDRDPKSWRALIIDAVTRPLFLLVWVYGVYFAAYPLARDVSAGETAHPLRLILDKLFDFGVFIALFWLLFRSTRIFESRLQLWASKTESRIDDLLVPLFTRSLRLAVPVIAVFFALPLLNLPAGFDSVIKTGSSILIIGLVSWVLCQMVFTVEKFVLNQYDIGVADNLRARAVYTQVMVLKKALLVIIGIFTAASILMLFEGVRRFGTSILASAGIVGIIVGFAAQRTIANLFAGFQLAMTQPIRIDDVVIVEGEWGRIEEITLTCVVVRIWDLRRLVLPINYFIEHPFQNWTRVSADILGTVFIYADYTVPVEEVRREFRRVVEQSPNWDKKVCGLQVTNATDRIVELRGLASAADASKAWDLRCEVREKMIDFLQRQYPHSLPKVRAIAETTTTPGEAISASAIGSQPEG